MFYRTIKSLTLENVILMLGGIDGVGSTTAKQIANKIAGIKYDFAGLEKSVVSGWDKGESKYNLLHNRINNLEESGISIEFPTDSATGTGVEFTGSPKPLFETKDAFLSAIESNGFVHTKLKDAKYLVTDSYDSKSSKMSEAKKRGIEILTYEDFSKRYITAS